MAIKTFEINLKTTRLIILILTAIYTFILTPLSLYYVHKLWVLNNRNIPFITKRHPRVVIFSVLAFNAYIIILKPICDITALYGIQLGIFRFLSNLSEIGLIIISLRVWLLFYDYNYELQTLALKWQTLITKTIPTRIPWTQRYQWMGNVKILLIIAAVVSIVVLTTTIICFVIFGEVSLYYTRIVIAALFMVFIAALIFNVRSCRDEFYIQKEFKLLMILIIISVIVYCIYQPLFDMNSNIRILLNNMWMSSFAFILSFIPTYWVMKQYNREMKPNKHRSVRALSMDSTNSNVRSKLSLEDIVSTRDGFDVFVNHLLREFSSENLFFLYEVMQTKNEMLMKQLVREEDVGFMLSFDIERMDAIRRAGSIVNDVNDLRRTVQYIMEQYIQSNAAYCVNLSARSRMKIMDTYHELEGGGKLVVEAEIVFDGEEQSQTSQRDSIDFAKINELELNKQYIVLFDDAMKEIVSLMRSDSLKRFYQTKEYRTMIQSTPMSA